MILAISDAVQVALIAGITAAAPAMLVAWLGYLKVRKTNTTVEETAKTVEIVHTLVNSQMGDTLFVAMVSARALAKSAPTAENKLLSETAERKYSDHQAKQAKVDTKA